MPLHNQFFSGDPSFLRLVHRSAFRMQEFGPRLQCEVRVPPHVQQTWAMTGKPVPPPIAGPALLDTGANMTVVEESALLALGLEAVDEIEVMTPSGTDRQLLYPAELLFPGTRLPSTVFAEVAGSRHLAAQGLIALVGRDVLSLGVLVYNGLAGNFSISFR